jgi:hypothetical protein
MEAAGSLETLVNIYQTARRRIPDETNIHGKIKLKWVLEIFFVSQLSGTSI